MSDAARHAGVARGLDHVGIAAADLDALAAAWTRLGFRLTPRARHSGRRNGGEAVEPFGSGNRCAMLRRGYIELIAVVDAARWPNRVDRFLARYAGLHIIALAIDDESAALARLRAAGVDMPGVSWLQRPVDDADPAGPQARFARLPLADAPEGEIQLIRHLTPEALWQDRFLDHPNRAEALEAVILAVAAPAETAARLSRLAGRPVLPDPAGGYRLALAEGCVRVLPPEALAEVLPGVAPPSLPWIAGLEVRTGDGGASLRREAAALPLRHVERGWMVPPEAAGGAAVLFT